MSNIDDMPPKCHDCPYWELAEDPYSCFKCENKLGQGRKRAPLEEDKSMDDLISREAAINAILASSLYESREELEKDAWYFKHPSADDFVKAIQAVESIPSGREKTTWIPAEKKLPKKGGKYLATYQIQYREDDYSDPELTIICFNTTRGWIKSHAVKIIAWAELPKPYIPDMRERSKQ